MQPHVALLLAACEIKSRSSDFPNEIDSCAIVTCG